ncbi:MAG: preprotein translocase subunit SecG [Sodalis sp. (in: enterobacteria)]
MYQTLLGVFLLVAVILVVLIMLQHGKIIDMQNSFCAGASGGLFCSRDSGNFMTRMTAVLATVFFILSLVLGNLSSNHGANGTQWDNLNQGQQMNKDKVNASIKSDNDIPQ